MVIVIMGNENGIQFFHWKIQVIHGAPRIVAGIEQQELTVDENGCTGLRSQLINRTACADQNGGDPVCPLQLCCRFTGLVQVVDDRAAEGSFTVAPQ